MTNIFFWSVRSVEIASLRLKIKTPPATQILLKMDFDSPDPDVEKEFPGLFASESAANRKKDDDDCK